MAPGFKFSPSQRRTLAALCDTFVPALDDAATAEVVRHQLELLAARPGGPPGREELDRRAEELIAYCRRSGSEVGAAEAFEQTFHDHIPAEFCRAVSILLTALGSRPGMLALCGVFTPFADLDAPAREVALRSMSDSMLGPKRQAFQMLKGLCCQKAFCGDARPCPNWPALGYADPESDSSVEAALEAAGGRPEHKFRMLNPSIKGDTKLDFDVVIVGSGCGGAVVAAELAQAGQRVLVLEKAAYAPRAGMTGLEGEAFGRFYEMGGLVVSQDTGVTVLAGSAFGGGSTVNWACSLRTPEHVRQEWAKEYGLSRIATDEFGQSLDAVCSRIRVTADGVSHSRNNRLLMEGCSRCGYSVDVAPQNMADVSPNAPGANFICFGDRYGLKQSMTETFLRDAAGAEAPAQFLDHCSVRRVLHESGVARGVEADVIGADGKACHVEVRARAVVVSCGSINSPALLLRSKLPNRNGQIGKNLRLHPVAGIYGKMPLGAPDVKVWEGAPMTTVSNAVAAGPAGDNYGAKLECPSVHPGLAGVLVPWLGGRQFKEFMLDFRRTAMQIALVRDRDAGEVRLDAATGEARLFYPIGEHDRKSLTEGIAASIRVLAAAGAEEIGTTQGQAMSGGRTLPPPAMREARERAVNELIAETQKVGFPLFKSVVASAHQMGTCRMGASAKDSVIDPDGESWEVKGLFVADASTFPTSSGVNPMLTTLAMAHFIAQQMKRKLQPTSRL